MLYTRLTPEITSSRAKMIAARMSTTKEAWDKMIAAAEQDPSITSTEIFVDYSKFASATDEHYATDYEDHPPLKNCLCRIVTQSSASCAHSPRRWLRETENEYRNHLTPPNKFNTKQRDMVHHTIAVVHTSKHRDGIMRSCPYVALRLFHSEHKGGPIDRKACDIVRAYPPLDWVRQGLRFTNDKIIWNQENRKRVERWEPSGSPYNCVLCQPVNNRPGLMGKPCLTSSPPLAHQNRVSIQLPRGPARRSLANPHRQRHHES